MSLTENSNQVFLPGVQQSKEESKDQETIQSSTTPDLGHHMGK